MSIEIEQDTIKDRLLGSPEIRYAFEYQSLFSNNQQVDSLLPTDTVSLAEFIDAQETSKTAMRQRVPNLYEIYQNDREDVEKNLFNDMLSWATNSTISVQEMEEFFKCCRLSWSEYWSESEFNHKTYSIFEPKQTVRPPEDKYISLENAYYQSELCRDAGGRVVATMGTFDFHSGHAKYLNQARELAGLGLVIAFITTDQEAKETRQGETNILDFQNRLRMVASHQGVDFCVQLPWKDEYSEPNLFDHHMIDVHSKLKADIRYVGELDERSTLIENQCKHGGTKLIYHNKTRVGGLSSTDLRKSLKNK